MNKKNSKLIEMCAVVSLCFIVLLIAVPAIIVENSRKNEKNYYKKLEQLINDSKQLLNYNRGIFVGLDDDCRESSLITIDMLDDFVDVNYSFRDNVYVRVYKNDDIYRFCVDIPNCTNFKFKQNTESASMICCDGNGFLAYVEQCKL